MKATVMRITRSNIFALTPFLLAGAVFTLAGCGEVEDTRPGKPVAHRQAAFKKIVRNFEPMGVMLREGVYEPIGFEKQAKQLAELRNEPWAFFGPDTQYPPSKSTAAVWTETDKFNKEKLNFIAVVEKLEKAAGSHEEKQVTLAYQAVHNSCKSCHKTFRER